MRQFSESFVEHNFYDDTSPQFVAKIIVEGVKNIYITFGDVTITDPGADILTNSLVSASGQSQSITPERGFSQIGRFNLSFSDLAPVTNISFTDILRDLSATYNRTINNAKVELYAGYEGMLFSDFAPITPLYVSNVANDELTYTITLSDTQRFLKKSAFGDKPKTTITTGIGTAVNVDLMVSSTDRFELVYHDEFWGNAPSTYAGYLKYRGVDSDGNDEVEYLRYDSKTDFSFHIVERGVFGTRTLDIQSSTVNDTYEVDECIYLDLPVPKMIVALMTNDLLGDAGESIPAHWGAEIDATFVNTSSFQNIGDDIWAIPLEFIDLDETDIKKFINKQCLSVMNLFMLVNQFGELSLRRFGDIRQSDAGNNSITYGELLDVSPISRDSRYIRNNFLIKWGWRPDKQVYRRSSLYADLSSVERNGGKKTEAYVIELLGVRNRDRYSGLLINQMAKSIRSRFSDPAIIQNVGVDARETIHLEVGDVVNLALDNQPDPSSADTFDGACEVQSIFWDFINGTSKLKLFSSAGRAGALELEEGDDVISFNSSGFTELVTGPLGTASGSEFIVANGADFPEGSYKYLDGTGDIVFDEIATPGFSVTFNGSVNFLGRDIELRGSPYIDGSNRGYAATAGGFGGGDVADLGFEQRQKPVAIIFDEYYFRVKVRDAIDGPSVPAVDPAFSSYKPKVDASNNLVGLPDKLFGNGSAKGGRLRAEITEGNITEFQGGDATKGGAGICFICDNLIYDAVSNDPIVDTSGGDGSLGGSIDYSGFGGAGIFHAGASGYGWPGLFLVYLKSRASIRPFLSDIHVAKTGANPTPPWVLTLPLNRTHYKTESGKNYGPPSGPNPNGSSFEPLNLLANKDLADLGLPVNNVEYLQRDAVVAPTPGVDSTNSAKPVEIQITEYLDTPKTPTADTTTLELTAIPDPSDAAFDYALFEYRVDGNNAWYEADYGISTESKIQVPSNGFKYYIRATSYNTGNKAGGVSMVEFTVKKKSLNPAEDETAADIVLPPIKGLELVNRINDDDWDKFKSPDAVFKWKKSSTSFASSPIALNGITDLYLDGYVVRVTKTDGTLLREEKIVDSTYVYSFDKNKKDTGGNPVREFIFKVKPSSANGFVSEYVGWPVENPAPESPAAISTEAGFTSINISYELPNDVDFVGVDLYFIEGDGDPLLADPIRISGNSFSMEGLTQGTEHRFILVSVDQFGTGNQSQIVSVITPTLIAEEVDGLGPYATVDIVDQAFLESYMADGSIVNALIAAGAVYGDVLLDGAVSTQKLAELAVEAGKLADSAVTASKIANLAVGTAAIQNLAVVDAKIGNVVASKLLAGTLAATESIQVGDASAGVLMSGGGYIQTTNTGYVVSMGAINVPGESANPLALYAYDGATYPWWFDIGGKAKIGALQLGSDGSITSTEFSIDGTTGAATFSGTLSAAGGTFGNESEDQFIKYDAGKLSVGSKTEIQGVNSYDNTTYYLEIPWYAYRDSSLFSTTGSPTSSLETTGDAIGCRKYTINNTSAILIFNSPYAASFSGVDMANDFKVKVKLSLTTTSTAEIVYYLNSFVSGGTATSAHIGFSKKSGGLYSYLRFGGGLITSNLLTTINTSMNEIEMVKTNGRVDYYLNGTLVGNELFSLAGYDTNVTRMPQVSLNNTGASSTTIKLGDFRIFGFRS